MTKSAKVQPPTTEQRATSGRAVYRGLRLQVPEGHSRFTRDQIQRAVEAALGKHADALARKTKA